MGQGVQVQRIFWTKLFPFVLLLWMPVPISFKIYCEYSCWISKLHVSSNSFCFAAQNCQGWLSERYTCVCTRGHDLHYNPRPRCRFPEATTTAE